MAIADTLHALPNFFPTTLSPFAASLLAEPPYIYEGKFQSAQSTICKSIIALSAEYHHLAAQMLQHQAQQERIAQWLQRCGVMQRFAQFQSLSALELALATLGGAVRSSSESERQQLQEGIMPHANIIVSSAWFWFVRQHGCRAFGEGDPAVPRFGERLAETIRIALEQPPISSYEAEFGQAHIPLHVRQRVFYPLWKRYCSVEDRAEHTRAESVFRIGKIRKELLIFAEAYIHKGVLSAPEDIWQMSIQDVCGLAHNSSI